MSNQLTPMQDAIEKIDTLIQNCQVQIDYFNEQCMETSKLCSESMQQGYKNTRKLLYELLPKEQQVIEENENLLDEITACIGNEYRLPFWIETKLNKRKLLQH